MANLQTAEDDHKPGKNQETASQRVIRTLYDMASAGLIQKSLLLTAFVRYKVANSSTRSYWKTVCSIGTRHAQDFAGSKRPMPTRRIGKLYHYASLINACLDDGYENSNPEILRCLLTSLAKDGQGLAGKKGSLTLGIKGHRSVCGQAEPGLASAGSDSGTQTGHCGHRFGEHYRTHTGRHGKFRGFTGGVLRRRFVGRIKSRPYCVF